MKSEKLAIKLLCLLILTIGVAHSFYVWPEPYEIIQGNGKNYCKLKPSFFTLTTTSTSPLLHNAIHRYLTQGLIFPFPNSYPYPSKHCTLRINLNNSKFGLRRAPTWC